MRSLSRRWKSLALVTAALVLGASTLVVSDSGKADAAKQVHAWMGGGAAGIAVELFLPSSIAVNVGDTVTWTNPYDEPHTVTYIVNPADLAPGLNAIFVPVGSPAGGDFDATRTLNSGAKVKDETYSLTFKTIGTYTFLCLLHPGMTVDVTVVPEGVQTPIPNLANAQETIDRGVAVGEAAAAATLASVPAPVTNPNGTRTWTIPESPTVPFEGATVDVMRFIPAEKNIGVGDTVRWLNNTHVPHTITFMPPGPPPEGFSPFAIVKPSQVYTPGTLVNSGLMGDEPAFTGGTEFSLTFNTAGKYTYICLLHADLGMAGVINVGQPSTPGITPPATGDAGLYGASSGAWMMLVGSVLFVFSIAAGVMVVRRE